MHGFHVLAVDREARQDRLNARQKLLLERKEDMVWSRGAAKRARERVSACVLDLAYLP